MKNYLRGFADWRRWRPPGRRWRGEELELPKGVFLLKTRPERGHYVFLAEAEGGRYIYSVLKFKDGRTAVGGKVTRNGEVVLKNSEEEVAKAQADSA